MAVAYRSQTSTTYASRTNTVLTAPSGLANDDILLAAVFVGANSTAPAVTAPAGFTALTGSPTSRSDSGGFNGRLNLFWKRAASESGSYTFSHSSASSQGLLLAYSGCVTFGSPIDASSNNVGDGATATATGITTTAANDLLVWISHDWEGTGALNPPSGFSERLDSLLYAADATQASAGASGNKTQTNANGVGGVWAAWLVALKPATGGGGSTLTAAAGSFTLSGKAAGLKVARRLTAAAGSMTLTGQAAALRVGRKIVAAPGAFSLTGQPAALRRAAKLPASTGTFALSGVSAALKATRKLPAAAGVFTLTGRDAALIYDPVTPVYELSAGTGAFALTGNSAGLRIARRLVAGSASFVLTGNTAALKASRRLVAQAGAFILTGWPAALVVEGSAVVDAPRTTLRSSISTRALLVAEISTRIQAPGRISTLHRLRGQIQ